MWNVLLIQYIPSLLLAFSSLDSPSSNLRSHFLPNYDFYMSRSPFNASNGTLLWTIAFGVLEIVISFLGYFEVSFSFFIFLYFLRKEKSKAFFGQERRSLCSYERWKQRFVFSPESFQMCEVRDVILVLKCDLSTIRYSCLQNTKVAV